MSWTFLWEKFRRKNLESGKETDALVRRDRWSREKRPMLSWEETDGLVRRDRCFRTKRPMLLCYAYKSLMSESLNVIPSRLSLTFVPRILHISSSTLTTKKLAGLPPCKTLQWRMRRTASSTLTHRSQQITFEVSEEGSEWVREWGSQWVSERVRKPVSEWESEEASEWVREWGSQWVSEWGSEEAT